MWETIKKILQKQGGTCIIIEEGKPFYVVSDFVSYQKLLESKDGFQEKIASTRISEEELLERINQEITNWKTAEVNEQVEDEMAEEDVKIENLPL